LEKQVPVNETRVRKDFLFSIITRIVFLQIHSISQFRDISVSAKRITLALLHEGHIRSAFSLPTAYTFTESIALQCSEAGNLSLIQVYKVHSPEKALRTHIAHKSYGIPIEKLKSECLSDNFGHFQDTLPSPRWNISCTQRRFKYPGPLFQLMGINVTG
jgi:hypothetical protein